MGRRLVCALLAALLSAACASRGARSFAPASEERAESALRAWEAFAARTGKAGDANLLYEAALSQKLLRTGGTLAVRLRGERVEGTLSGPFGSPIAVYEEGRLRGEKLEPLTLPARQLRAVLAGTWIGGPPTIAGIDGSEVLMRWVGEDAVEGVFDLGRGELVSLRMDRPEGELTARFSGSRDPWPERIDIEERRSGSKLRLERIAAEWIP
ncbi:MAG: hypothetical protein ACRD3M_09400 [Thermoanaerobaculia bacterium]